MHKSITHKHVSAYFVTRYKSGIVTFTLNTHEKWIPFHAGNEHLYFFGDPDVEHEDEDWLFIPKDDFVLTGTYIPYTLQDKDQITFCYIPLNMLLQNQEIKDTPS